LNQHSGFIIGASLATLRTPPPLRLRCWLCSLRSLAAPFGLPLRSFHSLVVTLSPLSLRSIPLPSLRSVVVNPYTRKGLRKPYTRCPPKPPCGFIASWGDCFEWFPTHSKLYSASGFGSLPKTLASIIYKPPLSGASLLPSPLRGEQTTNKMILW